VQKLGLKYWPKRVNWHLVLGSLAKERRGLELERLNQQELVGLFHYSTIGRTNFGFPGILVVKVIPEPKVP